MNKKDYKKLVEYEKNKIVILLKERDIIEKRLDELENELSNCICGEYQSSVEYKLTNEKSELISEYERIQNEIDMITESHEIDEHYLANRSTIIKKRTLPLVNAGVIVAIVASFTVYLAGFSESSFKISRNVDYNDDVSYITNTYSDGDISLVTDSSDDFYMKEGRIYNENGSSSKTAVSDISYFSAWINVDGKYQRDVINYRVLNSKILDNVDMLVDFTATDDFSFIEEFVDLDSVEKFTEYSDEVPDNMDEEVIFNHRFYDYDESLNELVADHDAFTQSMLAIAYVGMAFCLSYALASIANYKISTDTCEVLDYYNDSVKDYYMDYDVCYTLPSKRFRKLKNM